MKPSNSVSVTLTGNGGQSAFDMAPKDAQRLEKIIQEGSPLKSFAFQDTRSHNRVLIAIEKLFIIEVEN